MLKVTNITVLAVVAIAVGAMMIPGANLVLAAFADGGCGGWLGSNSGDHGIASNSPDDWVCAVAPGGSANVNDNTQINSASNHAHVHIHNHHGGKIENSGNVVQSIVQSNTIVASNDQHVGR